ncbi:MAG: S8 family serine peptidase [Chloroflexi bacterium]|nr:S8 family serine peptidase [Chloroflexota bacterium]
MKKKILSLFVVLVFILASFSSLTTSNGFAKAEAQGPIVTVEQAVIDEMDTKGSTSYWIQFKNTADLSPAHAMSWSDRGWFVYETLRKQAEASQAQVNGYLTASKVDFQSYWINNSILVKDSSRVVLNDIMRFSGVESIQARKSYILYEPEKGVETQDNVLNSIEPNLTHVNADDVWGMGFNGAGLVVANIDTGVRYTHQALVNQYRGNNNGSFDHNYNWLNPDNLNDKVPRDGNGHGTHTMGTMVGDDGGSNQIGIAPGAKWMACAGCPNGNCTDTALLGCGQFIAAPTDLTGANANPDMRPNAVNNSWGDCGQSYDNWYAGVIDAWLFAGVYPVFSNGNASNCQYSSPPGLNTVGNPARSGNVTGVGSTGQQNGLYANHSNWGPTDNPDTVNPTPGFAYMKPQVVAPGVNIRSSMNGSDTAYATSTGTSMSAPHVTGLVALIEHAAPCLTGDYAAIETIIESTATQITYDDGSPDTHTNYPNYATGWGEINALAAVNQAIGMCSAMGTLQGTVTEDGTNPVEGANIFADNSAGYVRNVYTAANGTYSVSLPVGTYTLVASKYGHNSDTVYDIAIKEGNVKTLNFLIPRLGATLVSGTVYDGGAAGADSHGYPLYSAISITAPGFNQTIYTDPFTGEYQIELSETVAYSFTVTPVPNGYTPITQTVIPTGQSLTKDFQVMVGAACSAPGYLGSGVNEGFEGGALPDGWTNYDYKGNEQVWLFNDPKGRGNKTPGGEGGFAILDSDHYGDGNSQDAGLRTPAMDFTGDAFVKLEFDTYFRQYSDSSATVRVSNDGGITWSDVWETNATLTEHVTVDISDYAAGRSSVIVEFKYVGSWAYYWQVDDVLLTPMDCSLTPGGVVAGYVYDDNDDSPLVGADVVSDNVSTQTFFIPEDPASKGLYWVFQPTSTDPEVVPFAASKNLYSSDQKNVTVEQSVIIRQDFNLGTGKLDFDPESFEVTMFIGDDENNQPLTISNLGASDVMFELFEKDQGVVLSKVNIPAFQGELPEDTQPISIGRAPLAENAGRFSASPVNPFKGILSGKPAFAMDVIPNPDNLMYIPDITVPGTWNEIGPTINSLYAGDFLAGDFTTLYAISYDDNNLHTVNTTTGEFTLVGAATPPAGKWSGLSGTPDGTLYGLTSVCGTSTNLVTVNPITAEVTNLGSLDGIACGIDLAYNTDDDMIYIVDIVTDNLFRVDPGTLTATQVGALGVNANYAQGMDFEEDSGILYWAAYTNSAELRIIDTNTGASALVGAFPDGTEVDCLAFATGGYSDVPWLSEAPDSGTVPAGGSVNVTVKIDPTRAGLSQPGDYLAVLRVKHNSPYTYPDIPVTLHLKAPGNYGTFKGHVYGLKTCDVNPTALEGAIVKFWQDGTVRFTTTTNAEGYYNYAGPEGSYDIEVLADGYISQHEFGAEAVGDGTTITDFALRLDAPCISVDPTSLEQSQPTNTVTTQTLKVKNTGARDGAFELLEMKPAGKNSDVGLILDDGTAEDSIGLTNGGQFLWLNRFTPPADAFPFTIHEIQVIFQDSVLLTDQFQVVIYSDTDGDPGNGAVYLGGQTFMPQYNDFTTFNVFTLTDPVTLDGPGDVLVGLINRSGRSGYEDYPAALDDSTSHHRSWIGLYAADPPEIPTLPPDDDWDIIDNFGFSGNWTIRAKGSSATGDIFWLSLDPTAGNVPAGSETDVTVTYDSTDLADGDYFASIRVKNPPATSINVPVTLHVIDLRYLYLPLVFR